MNVEIGAEAAKFPEKEYINVIAVVVFSIALHFSHFLSQLFKDDISQV